MPCRAPSKTAASGLDMKTSSSARVKEPDRAAVGGQLWGQVAAAVVMSMTPTIYGTTLSYAGLLLAESQSVDTARITIADATMIAAAANFGRMVACVLSAQLTDRLGVLRVIQLGTPLNLLAWPLMTLTSGRGTMMAGTILAGSVVGLTGLTGRLYIAEVTTSRFRPVLCYLPGVLLGLSLLVNFSLSAVVPWRYAVLGCGCAMSIVQVIGTILLPNSPRWLMNRGFADEQVRKAIVFYRGKTSDIGGELKEIQQSLRGQRNLSIPKQVRLIFTDWDVGKPCLLMAIQFTFETFCGGVVLNQYAHSVFQKAVKSLSPINCTQILAGLQIAAIAASGCLLQLMGRRTVLIGAAMITAFGQLVVAAFFQFEDVLASHQWLVVVGIAVANAASMGGISQLSHLYLGETLPLRVRQMVGSAISLYMGALSAGFIHLFPVLNAALGSAGLFAALAAVNALAVAFARCCLPETRGLSLEEVQTRHFSSRRSRKEEELMQQSQQRKDEEKRTADGSDAPRDAETGRQAPGDSEAVTTNGTTQSSNNGIPRKEGMLNAAFEDTEPRVRRRRISERPDEAQTDVGRSSPQSEAPATEAAGRKAAAGDGSQNGGQCVATICGDVLVAVEPSDQCIEAAVISPHNNVV